MAVSCRFVLEVLINFSDWSVDTQEYLMGSHHGCLVLFLRCSPASLTSLVWKGGQALESHLTVNNIQWILIITLCFSFLFF